MSSTLSVRDVCKQLGVSETTVRAWLHSGELRGFSVSRRAGSKKPRYRVKQQDLDCFILARTPAPPQPRRRRRKRDDSVIEFYR